LPDFYTLLKLAMNINTTASFLQVCECLESLDRWG
jgi:hypothetical protein